jgi:hypothetical protein
MESIVKWFPNGNGTQSENVGTVKSKYFSSFPTSMLGMHIKTK